MIPARMHEQLEEYSTLHNSDKDYVVTEILRSHLEEHHATRNGHAKRRK
jgi:hypothetical protein